MQSNPKILVLKAREIVYTLLLLLFLIMLVICLVLMFSGSQKKSRITEQSASPQTTDTSDAAERARNSVYTAGVYTTPVTLGDSTVDVEVTVDDSHINSIRLVNLSEATAASFPLVSPSLEHIASQILEQQTLEGITAPQENRYTAQLLLSAVAEALELASGT